MTRPPILRPLSRRSRRPEATTAIAALLAAILGSGACQERDPSNPFDPGNPGTAGAPELLRAIADDGSVHLNWDLGPITDASGLRAARSGGGRDSLLSLPLSRSGAVTDSGLANGQRYIYRLEVRDPRGRWLATRADTSEPSAAEVWVVGGVGCGLVAVAPDGRDAEQRGYGERELLDLVSTSDGGLWAADYLFGEILRFAPDGSLRDAIEHDSPNALAVDPSSGQLWVGSFPNRSITLFELNGRSAWADSSVGLIEDLAPAGRGGVWTCAREGMICRVRAGEVVARWDGFSWPVAVVEDAPGGALWIAERGGSGSPGVARLDPSDGSVLRISSGLLEPQDIARDGAGGVWVADPIRGGLAHLDENGTELEFVSLGPVDSVTRDAERGDLWVAASGAGWIRRVRGGTASPPPLRLVGHPVRVVVHSISLPISGRRESTRGS